MRRREHYYGTIPYIPDSSVVMENASLSLKGEK